MPITNTTQFGSYEKDPGVFYCQFETTFDNGNPVRKKLKHNSSDGTSLIATVEAQALAQRQRHDAQDAVIFGVDGPNGEADHTDVRRAYVVRAFQVYQEGDFVKSYDMFQRFMPSLVALGLTTAGYAALLDTTEANVTKLNQIWNYLDTNSAIWSAAP